MKNRLPTENDGFANTRLSTIQSHHDVPLPPRQEDSDVVTKQDLDNSVRVVVGQMDLMRQELQQQIYDSQHGHLTGFEGTVDDSQPILNSVPSLSPRSVTDQLGHHAFRYVMPPEDGMGSLRLSISHAASPSAFYSALNGYHTQYVDAHHHQQDPPFSHVDQKTGEGISHRDTDHSQFATVKGNYILHKQDDTDNYWKRIVKDDKTTLTAYGMIVHNDGHRRQLVYRADTGDLPSLQPENNFNSRFTRLSKYSENTLNEHDELLVKKFPEHNKEIWTYVGGNWKFHKLDCRSLLSGLRSGRSNQQASVIPSNPTDRGNRYSMRGPIVHPTAHPHPTLIRLPPPSSPSATRPLEHDDLPSLFRSSPADNCSRNDSRGSTHHRGSPTLRSGQGHYHNRSPSGVSSIGDAHQPSREEQSPSTEIPEQGDRGYPNGFIPSRMSDPPVTAFRYVSVPPGEEDADDKGGWYSK